MTAPNPSPEKTHVQIDRQRFLSKASLQKAWIRLRLWFTQDPGPEVQEKIETAEAQTLTAAGARLKGGAAKMAQLLAYWEDGDGFTTKEAKQALATLFDQIPAVDPQSIDQVVSEDLGSLPTQIFATWEPKPFAAASLGEVHGAVGHDQVAYAVKVQYPGIAEALHADVENSELLDRLVGGSLGENISAKAKQTLKTLLLEELDYRREAQYLVRFSDEFADEPALVFPKYNASLSSTRVLTTTRLEGETLFGFLEHAPDEQRNRLAHLLFLYGFGGPLRYGLLNTDPNPGNFLVLDQGARLGLLDFGACVELTEDQRTYERVFWQSLLAEDAEVLRYALHRMGVAQHVFEFDSDLYRRWERLLALPFRTQSFQWTSAYAKDLTQHTIDLVRGHRFTLPSDFLLLWRQRLGLAAILGSCSGRLDYRKLLMDLLRNPNEG